MPHDLAFLSPRSQAGRTIERTHCLLRQDRVLALARHELAARFRSFRLATFSADVVYRAMPPTVLSRGYYRAGWAIAFGTCGAAYPLVSSPRVVHSSVPCVMPQLLCVPSRIGARGVCQAVSPAIVNLACNAAGMHSNHMVIDLPSFLTKNTRFRKRGQYAAQPTFPVTTFLLGFCTAATWN